MSYGFHCTLDTRDFAAALGREVARRADVINLSLGGSRPCSSAEAEVYAAVRQQGVIVVAATGNDAAPVGSPAWLRRSGRAWKAR